MEFRYSLSALASPTSRRGLVARALRKESVPQLVDFRQRLRHQRLVRPDHPAVGWMVRQEVMQGDHPALRVGNIGREKGGQREPIRRLLDLQVVDGHDGEVLDTRFRSRDISQPLPEALVQKGANPRRGKVLIVDHQHGVYPTKLVVIYLSAAPPIEQDGADLLGKLRDPDLAVLLAGLYGVLLP